MKKPQRDRKQNRGFHRKVIRYDTTGRIPIRIDIPEELTALEAKTALEEFVGFIAEIAALPHADELSLAEMDKVARKIADKKNRAHPS